MLQQEFELLDILRSLNDYRGSMQLVACVLVIIGWIFVDHRNNKRETRKEIRTIISRCESKVDEILEKSFDYHTSSRHKDTLASRIKFQLQQLASDAKLLQDAKVMVDDKAIKDLRQTITLSNFDSSRNFVKQVPGAPLIESIEQASIALKDNLERSFYKKFKN